MAEFSGLLVKVRGDGRALAEHLAKTFGARSIEIEPILRLPAQRQRLPLVSLQRGL